MGARRRCGRRHLLKAMHSFTPLIRATARRLAGSLPACLDVDDLMSIGAIGLMKALDRADPTRAASFTAYARLKIRGAMIDEIRAIAPIPRWASAEGHPFGHSHELGDSHDVMDTNTPDPLSALVAARERAAVAEAIDRLTHKERCVVRWYYYEELTMKAIGARLNVVESRVSQLHTKALARLRAQSADRLWSDHHA